MDLWICDICGFLYHRAYIYFLALFHQVVMFSNSENNSDGVYYFCENEFCLPFRRDTKNCMRKTKYITKVT